MEKYSKNKNEFRTKIDECHLMFEKFKDADASLHKLTEFWVDAIVVKKSKNDFTFCNLEQAEFDEFSETLKTKIRNEKAIIYSEENNTDLSVYFDNNKLNPNQSEKIREQIQPNKNDTSVTHVTKNNFNYLKNEQKVNTNLATKSNPEFQEIKDKSNLIQELAQNIGDFLKSKHDYSITNAEISNSLIQEMVRIEMPNDFKESAFIETRGNVKNENQFDNNRLY